MKKTYTTPACTTFSVATAHILAASPDNEYKDNAGLIRFSDDKVDAGEAD